MTYRLKNFEFHEPVTIQAALLRLGELGDSAMLIAGGTDLVMDVMRRGRSPGHLISLAGIPEMSRIEADGDLHIGATAVFHRVQQSPLIRQRCAMLAEAAGCVGSRQVRNLATIGGNVCNALPCADSVPALTAAGAEAVLVSSSGQRRIPVEQFISGPHQTAIAKDEILLEFVLPPVPPATGSAYKSFTPRRALDLTIVGVAAQITLNTHSGLIEAASLALGNVNPAPLNARHAAHMLVGNTLSDELLAEVAQKALAGTHTRDSAVRASAEYRQQLVRVLAQRALSAAYKRAQIALSGDK